MSQVKRFENYINDLNARSAGKVQYKLIYLARHGQGYHNVKEAQVGRLAWEVFQKRIAIPIP